jgi:hypothetical protein
VHLIAVAQSVVEEAWENMGEVPKQICVFSVSVTAPSTDPC